MTISNQAGRTSFDRRQRRGVEGQPATLQQPLSTPVVNPLLAQVSNVLVGGTATAGDYTISVVDDQTGQALGEFTLTRVAETNAQIAAALAVGLAAVPGLNGVVTPVQNGGTPEQVDFAFDHEGFEYSFVLTAPAPGTMVAATTQAAGGVVQDFARFISTGPGKGKNPSIVVLGAGSTAADVRGIVLRPLGQFANEGSGLASADDGIQPGRVATMAFEEEILMENTSPSTTAENGSEVFVIINAAGGQEVGRCRADADGGNTVVLTKSQAYWTETTAPGALGAVRLRL